MRCFNCGRADGVQAYSFDLDLPPLHGCDLCVTALQLGDRELLAAMKRGGVSGSAARQPR